MLAKMNTRRSPHLPRILSGLAFLALSAFSHSLLAQAALRPGDSVDLRLGGVPSEETLQFSAIYTIDTRGYLNLPYIGEVKAAGMMPADVQRSVESKLKVDRIYTNPTVTINTDKAATFVTVGGAVRAPGRVPYTPDMTLMTAISASGGFNDFAGNRLRLRRGGKQVTLDVRDIRKNPAKDPPLQPGDQVEVDESFF